MPPLVETVPDVGAAEQVVFGSAAARVIGPWRPYSYSPGGVVIGRAVGAAAPGQVLDVVMRGPSPYYDYFNAVARSKAAPAPTCSYPEACLEPALPDGAPDTAACVLCLERARTTAAVPCGHMYACVTCVRASRPTQCAVCRQPIEKLIRIYQ
jgi:hypothetical protein